MEHEPKLSRRLFLKVSGLTTTTAVLAFLGKSIVTNEGAKKTQSEWDLLRDKPHELYGHEILQDVEKNIWNYPDNIAVARLLSYFEQGFPTQIRWAHNANIIDIGYALVSNYIQMIELDVHSHTIFNNTYLVNQAAIGHSTSDSDELLLNNVLPIFERKIKKGIKFDFKDPEVVTSVIAILEAKILKNRLEYPVILNADIFGPRGGKNKFTDQVPEFLNQCQNIPNAIISLGWQRSAERKTRMDLKMIESMLETIKEISQPIIFPFHIDDLKREDNWAYIQLLLAANNHFLMIWCGKDERLSQGDKNWILQNIPPNLISKTFLDVR